MSLLRITNVEKKYRKMESVVIEDLFSRLGENFQTSEAGVLRESCSRSLGPEGNIMQSDSVELGALRSVVEP